ncbi:MAG: hypothetical protein AAB390_01540 [Patescibacteria group bacterium]
MYFVEIFKLKDGGSQSLLANCFLENGSINFKGDEKFIESLRQNGITDYSSVDKNKLFPIDGLKFLEQLKYNFRSGYLNATDIKEM